MQRYEDDAQWKKIISSSALIAILISVLGLFALTTLSVQQRIKEIGIRKVLGASVANISFLVSKDFLKLVCIGLVIASPIASPLSTTIYTVEILNNTPGYNCGKTLTTQVAVLPTPTTNFSYSLNPCGGDVRFFDKSIDDIIGCTRFNGR